MAFVIAGPEVDHGGETRRRDGVIQIRFRAGLPLATLRHTSLHEYRHAAEYHADEWFDLETSERVAEAFAWAAARGWNP